MPYSVHTLLTFHGVLGPTSTSPQSWSMGIRFPIEPTFWAGYIADGGDPNDVAADLLTAFTDNLVPENFCQNVYLFGVKMVPIDEAGHYTTEPWTATYDLSAPYGTTATYRPFQDTVVVTMRHIGLGRGNFGRVYLPPMPIAPEISGLLNTVVRDNIASLSNNWLSATNDVLQALAGSSPEYLVSIIGNNTDASVKTVNETGVGLVIDTQRRRRDKLGENITYDFLALTP